MISITGLNIAEILEIISTSPVKDFLISLTASGGWDAIKKIVGCSKSDSVEKKIWDIFSGTMEQFYGQLHYSEYNEFIVVTSLLEELAKEGEALNDWNLRKCIEKAMYGDLEQLSDQNFNLWVSIFSNRCAQYPEIFQRYQIKKEIKESIFTDRNLLLRRICSKIRLSIGDEDHSYKHFQSIIENVKMTFRSSWKEDLLSLISQYSLIEDCWKEVDSLFDLIYSNENCELILNEVQELFSMCNTSKHPKKNNTGIREKIRHINFNKVWLIAGETGSGKTYLINEFLESVINSLEGLDGKIIPCLVDISKRIDAKSFESFLNEELNDFWGINFETLENLNKIMKDIGSNVCLIFDRVSNCFSTQEEWTEFIQGIKRCSKYDQLRWIITVDKCDVFYLENDAAFLKKYCLTWSTITQNRFEKESLFYDIFSLDQYNEKSHVVSSILRSRYHFAEDDLNSLSLMGIHTPKEAIIFGESVSERGMLGFPSTYFDYLKKITNWKNSELVALCENDIDQVLSPVIAYITSNHTDELDSARCGVSSMVPLKKVQLVHLDIKRDTNIYSLSQGKRIVVYSLNIYPFWAIKLVSTISQNVCNAVALLAKFPKDMQYYLIPSFVFYNYKELGKDINELICLFGVEDQNRVLINALFVAHREVTDFSNTLYKYLCENLEVYIDGPRACYSVLYFVFYSSLKMREKLDLLYKMESYIPRYEFEGVYERTFCAVIESARSEKNFKKNLLAVVNGKERSVNYINGKNAAMQYLFLPSVREKEIEKIIWDIVDYIRVHKLTQQIYSDIGKNESFMDFFFRRCISVYLSKNDNAIETIYKRFKKFFELEKPIGHFVKRNLTCAAGNVFSDMYNEEYNEKYIELVKRMAESTMMSDRETAFFLIENSISADNCKLHPMLKDILHQLSTDKYLIIRYKERIKELLK